MKKKIRLLVSTFGNDSGEIVKVKEETNGEIYYYDGFHRWCYVEKTEEGITFERITDV